MTKPRPALGPVLYFALAFTLGTYFTFAAVQGDYGIFRRVEVASDIAALTAERDRLAGALGALQNKTRRMSDDYLDLDLLDEQARDVLGLLRPDEVILPR